jgi:hypothetical protein
MLDLTKLALQMQGMSHHLTQEAIAGRQRLERAQTLLHQAQSQQETLVAQQHQWRDRLGFTAAEPLEPLNTRLTIPAPPSAHTVLATDGSQIAPSHHEIAYCYLINTGRIALHYGQGRHPLLDSIPEVFYQAEDLHISRQWGIRTEEWMGHRRTVSEALALTELAESITVFRAKVPSAQKSASPIATSSTIPASPATLALTDGSLIHWSLEALPTEARERLLPPMLQAWQRLRQLGIPLVGYLSASRSSEAMNFFRLTTCPHPHPDCTSHCFGKTDQAPCQVFSPLRDATLWATLLQPGDRSPLWKSHARILEQYGEHPIYFCYVHGGAEVARVEFPAWVVEAGHLDLALGMTLAQVQKGYGYPVALAEAHNQAVVRGGDRQRFFALLEQQMIRAGLRNVGTSYKETRKRGSIA